MVYTRINRSFVSRPTREIDLELLETLRAASRPCIPPPAGDDADVTVTIPAFAAVRVGIVRPAPETAERVDMTATIAPGAK